MATGELAWRLDPGTPPLTGDELFGCTKMSDVIGVSAGAGEDGHCPRHGMSCWGRLVTATLAARALGEQGLIDELATGGTRGTVAVLEQGHGDPLDTVRTRATRKGADWVLHGIKPAVVDGHTADWVIVVALGEDGVRSFLVRAPEVELVPSLDPTRKLTRLVLDGTPARPLGPAGSQVVLWRACSTTSPSPWRPSRSGSPTVPSSWPPSTPRSGWCSTSRSPPSRW